MAGMREVQQTLAIARTSLLFPKVLASWHIFDTELAFRTSIANSSVCLSTIGNTAPIDDCLLCKKKKKKKKRITDLTLLRECAVSVSVSHLFTLPSKVHQTKSTLRTPTKLWGTVQLLWNIWQSASRSTHSPATYYWKRGSASTTSRLAPSPWATPTRFLFGRQKEDALYDFSIAGIQILVFSMIFSSVFRSQNQHWTLLWLEIFNFESSSPLNPQSEIVFTACAPRFLVADATLHASFLHFFNFFYFLPPVYQFPSKKLPASAYLGRLMPLENEKYSLYIKT